LFGSGFVAETVPRFGTDLGHGLDEMHERTLLLENHSA